MEKKSGFTIIEVALVLMIAGLIFLMAFLALPSLWASQRDADRKARVMELVSDIKTYQTNNSRGALPVLSGDIEVFTLVEAKKTQGEDSSWKGMVRDYVNVDFADPTAPEEVQYRFFIVSCKNGEDPSRALTATETCSYGNANYNGENFNFGEINDEGNLNLESGVDHTIYVAIGATCDGDHAVKANSMRSVAAVQVMERGGRYCANT